MERSEVEESYLTVAEVAQLLKLNQQTVRNWIDQGSLPALRVGRRVRIKRSDLERVLADGYRAGTAAESRQASPSAEDFWGGEPVGNRRARPGRRAPCRADRPDGTLSRPDRHQRPRQPTVTAGRSMSFSDELDRQRAHVMRAVRQAGSGWAEAMRAHKLAPPDAGFAARLQALADAAESEQVAWEHAHAAGLLWRPVPGAESARAAIRAAARHRATRSAAAAGSGLTRRWPV